VLAILTCILARSKCPRPASVCDLSLVPLRAHSAGRPFLNLHYGDRQTARGETVRFLQAARADSGSLFVTHDS